MLQPSNVFPVCLEILFVYFNQIKYEIKKSTIKPKLILSTSANLTYGIDQDSFIKVRTCMCALHKTNDLVDIYCFKTIQSVFLPVSNFPLVLGGGRVHSSEHSRGGSSAACSGLHV